MAPAKLAVRQLRARVRPCRARAPQAPRWRVLAAAALLLSGVASMTGCSDSPTATQPQPQPDPRLTPGGGTTSTDATSHAFEQPAPNLSDEHLAKHGEGDIAFGRNFVTAPAAQFGGLGPIFNNVSCAGCHIHDGRDAGSLLLRVSMGPGGPHGGPLPVPGFGLQIQDRAVFGRVPEATIARREETASGSFGDGDPYTLRRSVFTLESPYTTLPAVLNSPRIGPAVFGLGLLEAIREADLLALADPDDADGDGISGRPNLVWDDEQAHAALGRFGWKANTATLRAQTAGAYNADMGVTSVVFPVESCAGQSVHEDGLADDPEIDEQTLAATTFYVRTLAVPAPRATGDPTVARGRQLFEQIGCVACHVPTHRTGTVPDLAELSGQTITPYTDLLLHDMGVGLADGRPDFQASGSEWRTPPLWGIGLLATVNGELRLLHDGRARSFWEAVLWHGGEAESARERARNLARADRAALAAFLGSL
jgi:CxxC motif-containing protein (DUF1111 family)